MKRTVGPSLAQARRPGTGHPRRTAAALLVAIGLVASVLITTNDAPGQASPVSTPAVVAVADVVGTPPGAPTQGTALPSIAARPATTPDIASLERILTAVLPTSIDTLESLAWADVVSGPQTAVLAAAVPSATDSDGDGVPDSVEQDLGSDPEERDTDGDGTPDGKEDPDRDGLTTLFELRKTRTDPGDPDSDNDGIRDSAEDPDRDKLSNRGEQKYKTNPRKADSDKDGRNDWHEDFDHDGKPNGLEQDRFRLPSDLKPKLKKANSDVAPAAAERCHSRRGETKPGSCAFLKHGDRFLLLIGDSHAVHWFPAIYRVAKEHGWRLVTMTKSACPFADVPSIRDGKRDTACEIWRDKAFAKVKRLRPDLVIASALDSYHFVGDEGHPTSPRSEALWGAGLRRSLRTLDKAAGKVLMLGDVQDWGSDALSCLAVHRNDVAACEVRADILVQVQREKTARKAAEAAGVRFASTRKLSCPYDPCPLIVDRYLVTRDGGHLTATYAEALWRGMDRLIRNR